MASMLGDGGFLQNPSSFATSGLPKADDYLGNVISKSTDYLAKLTTPRRKSFWDQ